jgi:type VI protein secretion system component Hcp
MCCSRGGISGDAVRARLRVAREAAAVHPDVPVLGGDDALRAGDLEADVVEQQPPVRQDVANVRDLDEPHPRTVSAAGGRGQRDFPSPRHLDSRLPRLYRQRQERELLGGNMRVSRSLSAVLAGACALGLAVGLAVTGGSAHQAAAQHAVTRSAASSASRGVAGEDAALTALLQSGVVTPPSALFMFINGIKGESTEKAHQNWIVVSGYHTSFARTCGDCPTQFGPLTLTLPYSLAVPPLLKALLTGKVFPTVEIQAEGPARTGIETNYLTITLSNVAVTSLNESSSGGRPDETLTLTATTFNVSYISPAGTSATFCFNFNTQTTC